MPTPQPYGDIFQANTPYTDKATNYLLQEQRQRELYKQKQAEQIDNELRTTMQGVRSGDVSKMADLYNDYKTSWQKLNFNPPKNQKEYLQAQRDLVEKKAAMFNHVALSKEQAARDDYALRAVGVDKNDQFVHNAYDLIMQRKKLPYDQMVQTTDENGKPVTIDPTDLDQIKRQIDVPGVMKAVTAARGKEQTYKGDRYKATPNDLKYTQDTYAYGNKPKQFFDSMSLSATQNPTKFLNTLQEPSPQEYIKTEQEYYAAMTPEVKKAWRIGEGEELPDDEGLSDVQKAIKYQAMKYAIMNPPRKSPSYITDEEQKMADEEAKQKRLISYRESVGDIYKKARIDYRNSANDQQKEGVIQKLVDDSFDAGQQKVATAVNGKYTPARLISVPVEFAKQYEKADPKLSGAKVRPVFYMTEDKKYVVPRYPREESYGQTPIPIKTYKAEIGKIILSKKDNEAEIELDNTNPEKPTTSPATKTKKSKVGALN